MRTCYLLLFFCCACLTAAAQTKTVKGTVRDETGIALAGASVAGRGTPIVTATDSGGHFRLVVPEKTTTLIISYTGMETQEAAITGGDVIVVLKGSASSLNDVVVIGYGTARRKDLTGSVASVSGKQIAAVPVANAAQALAGKVPGVNVTVQDGRPDASVSIRIRGGGSVSQSNEPLYIVDGFPVSNITDIPPNQIETIDILKDASSTAIYGARGANGVIIITTKNGKAGKLTIAYDNFVQWNKATKYLETMNAYDYIAYNWQYAKAISNSYADAWERLWAIGSYAAQYNNTEGIDHYKNTGARNFSKEAYNSSFSHSHNLSISNGNNKTKYILSMSYNDNQGMKINSWFKRMNAAFKVEQKLTNKLTLGFDTRYTNIEKMGDEGTTNGKGSVLSSAYQFRPIATADVLGELDDRKNSQLGLYDMVLQDRYNPVALMKDYQPLGKERSLRSNASLTWNILKGLTARSELGYNLNWNKGKIWSGAVYNNYLTDSGTKTFSGNATINTSEGWQLRWVNTLNYQVSGLGKAHNLNAIIGQEVNNSNSEGTSMWGLKYPVSFTSDRAFAMMDQYLATVGTTVNYGYSSTAGTPNRLTSYFGRANYTLLDKYLFSATLRADGSSRFAPSNRWAYFPAASFGWRISDENFLRDVSTINMLKLRVSYGSVGNDGISANLWKNQWTSNGLTQFSINEVRQSAYSPANTIANPNLKWETTITRNLGLDFTLLDKRLYGTIEGYWNSTKDLLMLTPISPISGFSFTYQNVGATSNRGIELSLGSDLVRGKDFNLSASFNISINRGRIDELSPGITGLYKSQWGSTVTQPNTGDYILQVGKPVGQVRGYTYDGWYKPEDFTYANGVYTLNKSKDNPDIGSGIIGTVFGTTTSKPAGQVAHPGVIKFKDLTGDGVVDEKDVSIIGDMNPKHTGGFNLNASYRNLDFAMNFNWSYGNKVYNATYLAAFMGSKEDGLYKNRLNYLSSSYRLYDIQGGQLVKVTDPAGLNALNANATTFLPYQENPVVSSLGIQDGSFLRLNTVTLGYSLPAGILQKMHISRLRLYGSIFNALLFTSYKGLDPEVNTNTSQGGAQYPTTGLDWGAYPRARSFTLGLNVEF
ncbi:TonB-linked outer membrane protein, SusC/RagA family [Filimonas lacunae]|uniref:TonB-linked outer membrane protein, SusC/RagA family n=1 Tax=Filimonas lacunae TaxID=477680 RepID=A0A1N7MY42_9BACT|nr:TonB-dependent receptor [Filimonas lacunae]SIS90938.1 TonB-linked outer membrane protein, SusC/RagA family [Filimonas lacunae]